MIETYRQELEGFLHEHLQRRAAEMPTRAQTLASAMEYSLHSGGKRFRPSVAYLAAEALGCGSQRVTPFAAAIELIHTYSLIHDDLPAMDDDDIRRGQPTNHRVFGEATAILAGDALLTEAFHILASSYAEIPEIGLELTRLVSEASGMIGMIAGQIIDITLNAGRESDQNIMYETLLKLHELKTGALIRCAAEGAAVVARVPLEEREALASYGALLGLAFQLADDVLDHNPSHAEASGFPKWIGLNETHQLLKKTTDQALEKIGSFGSRAQGLRDLLQLNIQRKK